MAAQNYRLLEVKLKTSSFGKEKKKKKNIGKRYAVLWIQPDGLKLRTKIVSDRKHSAVHGERFVFSVPESFFGYKKSSVTIELYRQRKFFEDVPIGKAFFSLGLLAPEEEEEEEDYESDSEYLSVSGTTDHEKECIYDDSDDEKGLYLDFYDNLYEEEDDGDEDGEDQEEGVEKLPPPLMKARGQVKVADGSEEEWILDVEMAVWEGYIKLVGDGNQGLAMRYDEFMGQQNNGDFSTSVRMKKSWICMAPPAAAAKDGNKKTSKKN